MTGKKLGEKKEKIHKCQVNEMGGTSLKKMGQKNPLTGCVLETNGEIWARGQQPAAADKLFLKKEEQWEGGRKKSVERKSLAGPSAGNRGFLPDVNKEK